MVTGQQGTDAISANLDANLDAKLSVSPTSNPLITWVPVHKISDSLLEYVPSASKTSTLWQHALSEGNLSALFQFTVAQLAEQLQLQWVSIWLVLSDGQTVQRVASIAGSEDESLTLSVHSHPQLQVLFQSQQPLSLDPHSSLGLDGLIEHPRQAQLQEGRGINLAIADRDILGFLEVYTDADRTLDRDEIALLETATQVLATAIQRKRTEELLQLQTQVLEKIASGATLPEVFGRLYGLLELQAPGAICSARLFDSTVNQLRSINLSGGDEEILASDGVFVGEKTASCGTAAHRKEAIFVENIAQDPLWENFQELAQGADIQACWSSPFFSGAGDLLGTFSLSHRLPCQPSAYHLKILETATYLASIAVERQLAAEHLKQQALYDALTGLPNRILFMEKLRQRLHVVQTYQMLTEPPKQPYEFAVLFLDVDHFKLVNDSLGHNIGDQLLMEIVRLVKRCIRTKDTFARLGGDEFAIILDAIEDVAQAQLIADRIRAVLSFPLRLNDNEVFTSVSIGIAHSSNGYSLPEELLRDADTAMYRAKAQGRAHYAVFDKEMHTHALSRLHIEMDLRHVVEDLFLNHTSQLQLYYQPIVSLKSGEIVGFEALIRWLHPERGLISPAEFIPVAEETGLIVPIGRWVLHEACHQLHRWQEKWEQARNLVMSINVSSRQLLQPDFTSQIDQILQATQISTASIKLEITESVLMEAGSCVTEQLAQMQDLGVRLSLDDFGTGYSSLNYLYRFPINTLKVDRSFVDGLGSGQDQIVQTIIALAHGLSMDVTAEGVETHEQVATLKALGCEFGQGYLFSRPVAKEEAEQLIMQPRCFVKLES